MDKANILGTLKQCFLKILPTEDARTNLSPLNFTAAFIFCFMGDSKLFSLESIRRWMMIQFETKISKGAFWERLSGERLKSYLRLLVKEMMKQLACSALSGVEILTSLEVSAIYLVDSSSITLWDGSKENFPGTRTESGIKWHLCFNLLSGVMTWFDITPTSTHDSRCFPPISLLKGILTIFDLGYWDYKLLGSIEDAKGYFLSRIKVNSTIIIEKVVKGISPLHAGLKLSALSFKRRGHEIVELLGQVKNNGKLHRYRIIGFWNPQEKKYHWYITNSKAPSSAIYSLYRLRWQVELIFKSCKNSLNFNQIPSNNVNIIESILLAHIAAHLATHTILSIGLGELDPKKKLAISFQRIAMVAIILANDFLKFLVRKSKKIKEALLKKIIIISSEIYDPNYKHRPTSIQQLEKKLFDLKKIKETNCIILKFNRPKKNESVCNIKTRGAA